MNEHPLNALPQGYRIQEYEFVRVLGFGGFGVTYLGYDHNLDKAVAIKEYQPADIAIRTENQSIAPKASTFREDFDWGLERFLNEARTLARFDHRNIVKVHRFFEANGTAYIVMEYAEGETLTAYLSRKGTLDEAELKRVLIPILDGLETIHGADFLHRDIKPSNIVLRDEDSSPVLLDFGAARHAVGARSRSVTTIVTPAYAPIEQYSSRGNQGPWTDIYALGAVCYKALTGETPADAIDRLEHDPLEPVTKRCSDKGGRGFLKAIDWALNVREGDRPQTITSWKTAVLSAGRTPQKVLPLPKSNLQPHSTQRKLSRSNWVVMILFLTVITSGIVIAIQQEIEQRAEEARHTAAVQARQAAVEAERQARAAEAARRAAVEAEQRRQARAAEEARATAEAEQVRAVEEAQRTRFARSFGRSRRAVTGANPAQEATEFELLGRPATEKSTEKIPSFTRGSHQDDVLRLQGSPSSITTLRNEEIWSYGGSSVTIDLRTKTVKEWSDYSGNLHVSLPPGNRVTQGRYFTRGSHQDDVLRLQGSPSSITTLRNEEIWSYGGSSVTIDLRTKTVKEWSDYSGNLHVSLPPGNRVTQGRYFTRGSHQDDVLRLQGSPSSITTLRNEEIWSYGGSSVTIDLRTKTVKEWSDYSGNLHVSLPPGNRVTQGRYFTRGSHQDDVLRLQGSPSSITTLRNEEIWSYGGSSVTIDLRTKTVKEWSDYSGTLKAKL